MSNEHHVHGMDGNPDFILLLLGLGALLLYLYAVVKSNRMYRKWPFARAIYWFLGLLCALLSVAGPLARFAHINFTAHMFDHLLLGMLAPLFIALASPVTLLLRTLPLQSSRRCARILRSLPFRILSDPFASSTLNIGGLCILYTTNLYANMHHSYMLFLAVHLHVFLAGYLFTTSMIYIDKPSHRTSYAYRSIAFILSMAAHGILSKTLYANALDSIFSSVQVANGTMLMYYGGDAIEILILVIFFSQWFKSIHPRHTVIPIQKELYPSKK
ncbi:cytochrome c oxidase assembly protein [Paenibacillus oryzisoli]|uniref:Cytochrome c oxidase assembly protein n=1 Tax=Paenibacillus oryzisoli TaxID=1850517 RepID=A0A198A1H5_9BACL|nr:cytochrome c oxidase assembly protein [Paenibacillus oryzisoli]OAS14871.1 hypothetical protein A8708_05060 [Paenibacillus oryzisoli]